MTSGGSRNRSGPRPDPNSATSERRGLTFKLLPREGFTGRIPAFPLPEPSSRERALWKLLWRMPQAAMWNAESWRIYTVGQYTRWAVRAEDPAAAAAILGGVQRLADQIGLTPAGLKENGWRLSVDEVGAQRQATATPTEKPARTKAASSRRLRAVE